MMGSPGGRVHGQRNPPSPPRKKTHAQRRSLRMAQLRLLRHSGRLGDRAILGAFGLTLLRQQYHPYVAIAGEIASGRVRDLLQGQRVQPFIETVYLLERLATPHHSLDLVEPEPIVSQLFLSGSAQQLLGRIQVFLLASVAQPLQLCHHLVQ